MESVKRLLVDMRIRVPLIVFTSFLLASTGWLAWMYHLTSIISPVYVDVLTMVMGYLMQAAGIATFIFAGRGRSEALLRRAATASIVLYVITLMPATLTPNLAATLAFGFLANLLCGVMQGYYLYLLARHLDKDHRGQSFGGAYAASTVISWLLSAVLGGNLTRGVFGLLTCALMAVPTALLTRMPLPHPLPPEKGPTPPASKSMKLMACFVIVLMSITKSAGYGFPATDLMEGVNLELSRLLYGIGLVLAGIASDRDRKYGALFCAAGLVTPFLMLALSGAAAPATLLWGLGYLLFGFFSVFRAILFCDLASRESQPLIAATGLLLGRVGDALGTALYLALSSAPLVLITMTAVLFSFTMVLFFLFYQQLFVPEAAPAPTEQEIFEHFSARHDLSAREREVLRLVLAERSNSEIAAELFVSEATVKFHVRNLLKKTGCKNRLEIIRLYAQH